jgi:hypothetical protein
MQPVMYFISQFALKVVHFSSALKSRYIDLVICLTFLHRWARWLTRQTLFTVYRLPTKESKLLFSVFVCSKQKEVAVFRVYIYIYIYMENGTKYILYIYLHRHIHTYVYCGFKRKPRAFFLNPFTACSSDKQNFVICAFVEDETNGSYPQANRLNGLSESHW